MSVYLDANVIVSLFVADPLSARATAFLRTRPPEMIVSDFAGAEFSSVIARLVRMRELTRADAKTAFAHFDDWIRKETARVKTTGADIEAAETALRRLDLNLRTPDAINIAIAQRSGSELATFDKHMAEAAKKLGLSVARL